MPYLQSIRREMLAPSLIVKELAELFPGGVTELALHGQYDAERLSAIAAGKEPSSRMSFSRFVGRIRRKNENRIRPMLLRRLILVELLYCARNVLKALVFAGFIEMSHEELDRMEEDQRAAIAARREATRQSRAARNRTYRKRRKAREAAKAAQGPASPNPEGATGAA